MPADRLFHPRLGHSVKVSALSDLEFRVWTTYQLAADDFGVIRASPLAVQAANDALAKRSTRVISRSLGRLVDVDLVRPFTHQRALYIYQRDWQDFQKVRFPAKTIQPLPLGDDRDVTPKTRELWLAHPGGRSLKEVVEKFGSTSEVHSGSTSEVDPELLRARTRETANGLRLTANGSVGGLGGDAPSKTPIDAIDELSDRAGRFCERYRWDLYPKFRGVAYTPTRIVEQSDLESAMRLCQAHSDARLETLAEAFLLIPGDREAFLRNKTRTISMFLHMAPTIEEYLNQEGGET